MQVKSSFKNNLEPNLKNTKSIWLRFAAVTLAVILCFTPFVDLWGSYQDFF